MYIYEKKIHATWIKIITYNLYSITYSIISNHSMNIAAPTFNMVHKKFILQKFVSDTKYSYDKHYVHNDILRCFIDHFEHLVYTICPGSSDPFYIVTHYNIKWVITSWTYSKLSSP